MPRSDHSRDLREALEAARAAIASARIGLDQRAVAVSVLEELERGAHALAVAGTSRAAPAASPLDVEREGRVTAEASQRRTEFSQEATSTLFASPLDPAVRLETLTSLLVPDLADWCFCDLFVDGGARRIGARTWNPDREELARGLEGPQDVTSPLMSATMHVAREGRPLAGFERTASDVSEPFGALLDLLGARSFLAVPLCAAGRVVGVLTLLFAESNRRYTQEDLRLVEDLAARAALAVENARLVAQLERAVQARDDMMAVVSHDLRNPLSSIQMSANLLQGQLGDEQKLGRGSATNIILRSVARMQTLIRDLLDVASLEGGGVTVTLRDCSVRSLLTEAAELIQPLATEKEILLDVLYPLAELQVAADAERVQQVFSNLLGNAVKFTARGGRITLSAVGAGARCRFTVADNGPGIAADQLPHVFDRFWRARTQRSTEGAGLGLAIAKGIVTAHAGALTVESIVGKGTSFAFSLEASAAAG